MGGDHGLAAVVPAAVDLLNQHPEVELLLVGPEASLQAAMGSLAEADGLRARWRTVHAPEVVAMEERPGRALRSGGRSSMHRALELLAAGRADAVVSGGNTGALMAMGRKLCGTLPGIDRPAICSLLPARTRPCYLLDLGANVDSQARHLHQFATMGAALAAALHDCPRPGVVLLNVGRERWRGSEVVQRAAELIEADPGLHFLGFVEGDELFVTEAEVIVCDGAVGNVALKACEGTAALLLDRLRRFAGAGQGEPLTGLLRELSPETYNGAVLLGLAGAVIKSHGGSGRVGLAAALGRAVATVQADVTGRLQRRLERSC